MAVLVCGNFFFVHNGSPFFEFQVNRCLRLVDSVEEDVNGIVICKFWEAPYTAYPAPSPLPLSFITDRADRIFEPSIGRADRSITAIIPHISITVLTRRRGISYKFLSCLYAT